MDQSIEQQKKFIIMAQKIVLIILQQIFSYIRTFLVTPIIMFYGVAFVLFLFTIWSFLDPSMNLSALPFAKYYISPNFSINLQTEDIKIIFLKITGIISFVVYIGQIIIEKIIKKELKINYLSKLGLQLLILTLIYSFLIISAYFKLGWFQSGNKIIGAFITFYVITLIIVLTLQIILFPMHSILFNIRKNLNPTKP